MHKEINVIALVKESERYVFSYGDADESRILDTFGKYAADKNLSFTWYDAAVLSQKVRKLRQESEMDATHNRLEQMF